LTDTLIANSDDKRYLNKKFMLLQEVITGGIKRVRRVDGKKTPRFLTTTGLLKLIWQRPGYFE